MGMGMDLILGGVVGLLVGVGLAMFLKKGGGNASAVKELKAEHDQYRKQVDEHFVNTAVLLKGLTEQYRDVYRHIATGAGELCSEEAKALQVDMEETALLAQPEEVEVATEGVAEETGAPEETEANVDINETGASSADNLKEEPVTNDDDVPLASEVEMSADIAEEIKNQATKKG